MKTAHRIYSAMWMVFVYQPTVAIAWGQSTCVEVGAAVIVPTTITLPVDGEPDPEHTYIHIRTPTELIPTSRVSPVGGSSATLSATGPTIATISFKGAFVGDAQLSVNTSMNVFHLDIHRYKDIGGVLGTDNDGMLDSWTLELSHGDSNSHRFCFGVGHTPQVPAFKLELASLHEKIVSLESGTRGVVTSENDNISTGTTPPDVNNPAVVSRYIAVKGQIIMALMG